MKKITSSHSTAALLLALTATLLGSGCSKNPSVQATAKKLDSASYAEVLGYNGSLSPKSRTFVSFGELPPTVKRAMLDYIKTGEWTQSNYAHPQAFIRIQDPARSQDSYWAVCIDTRGNLVGILPVRDARSIPAVGDYHMIVNKTPRNPGLSYAILKGLQDSDSFRKSIRKNAGLDTPAPVAPIKIVTPPPAPIVPASNQVTDTPKPVAPAAAAEKTNDPAEEDLFGESTETTEEETTTTETPNGEAETTTTEEVTF